MKYEDFMELPLSKLRGMDIDNKADEEMLQRAILEKEKFLPKDNFIKRDDVETDEIDSPEKEREAEAKLEERRRAFELKREQDELDRLEKQVASESLPLDEMSSVLEELKEDIPKIQEEIVKVIEENIDDGIKCRECGSRGFRHKRGCPKLLK